MDLRELTIINNYEETLFGVPRSGLGATKVLSQVSNQPNTDHTDQRFT